MKSSLNRRQRENGRSRSLVWAFLLRAPHALAVFVVGLGPVAAWGQASAEPYDELSDIQLSVRELMHWETQQALAQVSPSATAREPLQGVRLGSNSPGVNESPKLLAIYGVGRKLLAEVSIGAETLIFLKGHPVPVGYKAGAAPYRLAKWDGHCISLDTVHRAGQAERAEEVTMSPGTNPGSKSGVDEASGPLCLKPQAGKG